MKIENIKFKAKRLDNGEWVEGDLKHSTSYVGIGYPSSAFPDVPIVHRVDPSSVCMFTGLKDCKGNKLYEHDVVKNYPFIPSEIVWSEELGGYYLKHANGKIEGKPLGHYLSLGKFIVVGNKFDK